MELFPGTFFTTTLPPPRILIVEDHAPIAMHLGMLIRQWGYRVAGWAISGDQALEVIQFYPPDLVISNFKLQGGMNGLELVGRIQSRWAIPVLFFSGVDRQDLPASIFWSRKVQFLAKPVQPAQLRLSLHQMLA